MSKQDQSLITVRTAVILLLSLVCGAVVAGLTFVAEGHVAIAILAGLTATAAAVEFFHRVIAQDDD